jgi:hypothetical protein
MSQFLKTRLQNIPTDIKAKNWKLKWQPTVVCITSKEMQLSFCWREASE